MSSYLNVMSANTKTHTELNTNNKEEIVQRCSHQYTKYLFPSYPSFAMLVKSHFKIILEFVKGLNTLSLLINYLRFHH